MGFSLSSHQSLLHLFLLLCCFSLGTAQQPYVGLTTSDCNNQHNSSSGLGYFCNGVNRSCQTYLTFRSTPTYNTVVAISDLFSADPFEISQINNVSETSTLETNKLVFVKVNCSCSGQFYQSNKPYRAQQSDQYSSIANIVFQGLTTCQALSNQSDNPPAIKITVNQIINVPLRCACPTKNQSDLGFNYLMSYIVHEGDTLAIISRSFGADIDSVSEANGLSDTNIFPNTTLLIPLENPPSSSQTTEPPPPPPPPPTSPPNSNESSKTWLYALLGALGGAALLLGIGAIICCRVLKKGKKKSDPILVSESFEAREKSVEKSMEESQDFLDHLSDIAQSLKVYSFKELQLATNDFSPSCWIKGSVYRGTINGDSAAIKKMDGDISKEINLLQKINHSNVIRLSGVCFHEGYWYLVYEYASNGPLSDWIFNSGKFLNWTQRIHIALDVATGLNYLHGFTNPSHVHKDIKSSNILLDSDFRAKIANFGLARSTQGQDGQFSLTKHIVGTVGYMAPEYLENGLVSPKLDVYAFGVLLLEMLTGKNVGVLYEENKHLSDALSDVLKDEGQERLKDFVDPSMGENNPSELVNFVVQIIESCLQKNPEARPHMDEIVQHLSRTLSNSLTWELSNNVST